MGTSILHEWRRQFWTRNWGRYSWKNLKHSDLSLKVREIMEAMDISDGSVDFDYSGLKKLRAKWVALLLTTEYKRNHITSV